jgi:O-acetyl-ADP-ribose deacetylase (regulator of RNase III)
MIEFTRGDLLAADVEALVNAVNTVDVMGKGLARLRDRLIGGRRQRASTRR